MLINFLIHIVTIQTNRNASYGPYSRTMRMICHHQQQMNQLVLQPGQPRQASTRNVHNSPPSLITLVITLATIPFHDCYNPLHQSALISGLAGSTIYFQVFLGLPPCLTPRFQDNLSLNLTPHIHLIYLISTRCNTTSFTLFSGHISLPHSIWGCKQINLSTKLQVSKCEYL